MKVVKITESQLKKMVSDVVKEQKMEENYMFFSNLDQIERQCKMLREMDPKVIDSLLSNGHDWADDHFTEAKSLIDQVFDFIMNEVKGHKTDKESVSADMDSFSLNEEEEIDEKCWDGYKEIGGKIKNGKRVPNCVPTNEASNPAQQAAIAINMKKQGKSPKNESMEEIDESKNKPTNPKLWAACLAWARSKYDVCPSAYCNGAAAKRYKSKGGGWRKVK